MYSCLHVGIGWRSPIRAGRRCGLFPFLAFASRRALAGNARRQSQALSRAYRGHSPRCGAIAPARRRRLPKRLNLRDVVVGIRFRVTGSKFEQTLTMYEQARKYFPQRYRSLLRLRPPALLKVNLRNEYPRGYVTRRIRADGGFYFGPFSSRRAAEGFSESFLDIFKIRRCQIKIRRDPTFPGCIYSEMKMCLAPCFAGCSQEEYDIEVGRVLKTLESGGSFLIREIADPARSRQRSSGFRKGRRTSQAPRKGFWHIARLGRIDAPNRRNRRRDFAACSRRKNNCGVPGSCGDLVRAFISAFCGTIQRAKVGRRNFASSSGPASKCRTTYTNPCQSRFRRRNLFASPTGRG